MFAAWLMMLYSQKQNYAQTYKRDRRHAKDLGAGTQEYRQQHSLPWRPKNIAVDQLPSEFLLSVLPGIDLRLKVLVIGLILTVQISSLK